MRPTAQNPFPGKNNSLYSQMVSPVDDPTPQPTPGTTVPDPDAGRVDPGSGNSGGGFGSIDWFLVSAFLFIIVVISGIVYFTLRYFKLKDRDEKAKNWALFEVRVPKENETEVGVAEKMFANFSGIGGGGKGFLAKHLTVKNSISFEIVGLPESIRFYIYCPRKLASWVEKQVLGSYQDAEFLEAKEYNIFKDGGKVAFAEFEQSDDPFYPLKTYESFEGDPLANITSSLSNVSDEEGMVIQMVISPEGSGWQKNGRKFVTKVEENNADPEKKRMGVSEEQLKEISKKCSKPGFNVALRVVASAADETTAKMHMDNVVGAFNQFDNSGMNELEKKKIGKLSQRDFMNDFIYRHPSMDSGLILNTEELASLYHFPNEEVKTPHINWLMSREAPADSMVPQDGTWLGTAKFRGRAKDVYIRSEDRMRHTYVIGQTGAGKSYVLQSMALQDAYDGNGFAIIDPHGSMAEYVLDRIPHERAEDVIYFNPSDYERPLGFNIMDFYDEQDKHRVVNGFLGLLTKMFDPKGQGITGPRFEQAVRNAMLTVMSERGSTLIEVVRVITDEEWMKEKWLPIIKDDVVKRYWTDQIAQTSDFHKSEILGYIVSKFDRFVTNVAMRNIIGQSESSFDVRNVMDENKILIVNLSKGLIGEENAQFLGLLLVPKILSAALSREDIPEEEREDFYLYVDEFQNFATPDFAQILSEARKYRLSLNVGNQYIAQMSDEVKDAIFGNVGSLITMRVGPDDGQYLESQYEPIFSETDLINQPNIHACVKLLVDGKYPPPFSMSTRYEKERYPKNEEVSALIKRISRLRYGRDKEVVEEEIRKRANLTSDSAKGKKKKMPPPPSLPSR
jgi:hypothetical protein